MKGSSDSTFEISGTVFFDYNGNGVHDSHEPIIVDAIVQVGSLQSATDDKGRYRVSGVPRGRHEVRLVARDFGYISFSLEEFQSIEIGVELEVEGDVRRDFGLMQGFLTQPIALGMDYILLSHNDLDHRIGHIRNWAGDNTQAVVFNDDDWHACVPGTFDQHQGTDWSVPIGTPILAMAPGVVLALYDDPRFPKDIQLLHETGTRKLVTTYGHNLENRASMGEKVRRGQMIALSGADAGEGNTTCPHIHFNLYEVPMELTDLTEIRQYVKSQPDRVVYPDGEWVKLVMDPYRDVARVDSENFWTKDNDPQFFGE